MVRSAHSPELSLGYRIGYRLRLVALTVFGPADLEERVDPKALLRLERSRREAAAHHGSA